MKTVRRPPYPKWNPGYFPCSSLTPFLPLSSRRPSVSFGGFGLRLTFEIPFAPPVISLPEVVNKWTVLGATLTLLLVSEVGVLSINETVGAKRALRFVLIMLVIGNLSGLFCVALAWQLSEPPLTWPFQISVWILALTALSLAPRMGIIRQSIRRREIRPASSGNLMEPKNWEAKHRRPVQRRQQQARPAPQPSSRTLPFRFPHAVHRCPSVDSGLD